MRAIEARREDAHPHARPEWFSGPVAIQELSEASDPPGLEIFAVFFDPGARTLPHTHSTDQLLYFLEGEGVVGAQGDRRLYLPGGMAVIRPTNGTGTARRRRRRCVISPSDPAVRPRGRRTFRCMTGTNT